MKANKINYCSTFWSDDTFHYPFATHPDKRERSGKKGARDLKFSARGAAEKQNELQHKITYIVCDVL